MNPGKYRKPLYSSRPIELLLPRLDKVKQTGPGRWTARCPAHEDRHPSLSIREADNGCVLIYCFAGCSAAEITAAVGLELSDLFPPKEPPDWNRPFIPPKKPYVPAADVLRLIQHEMFVVLTAAYTALRGELSRDDVARLELAVERLSDAMKLAGVRLSDLAGSGGIARPRETRPACSGSGSRPVRS